MVALSSLASGQNSVADRGSGASFWPQIGLKTSDMDTNLGYLLPILSSP